jgi:triphosphatase
MFGTGGSRGSVRPRAVIDVGSNTEAFMEYRSDEQKEAKSDTRRSADTDHQEIEWQYDAPGGLERVEEWLVGGGSEELARSGLAILKGSSKELVDTYYDTEDRRLYRAGYALRIRRKTPDGGPEATMKSLVSAGGAAGNLRKWREISEQLKSDETDALSVAPGPVGVRLRELVGSREVRRIFEVRTHRQTFDLMLAGQRFADPEKALAGGSAGAARVGEVALDRSEIPLGAGTKSAHLVRVEVEVDASVTVASPELEDFVKTMERALGLRPATTSKYEAGLFATGQSPDSIANLRGGASEKG